MLPDWDDFPSRLTPCGTGRDYQVGPFRCIAYWIGDAETFAPVGATGGFCVYVFVDRKKVGTWNWARSVEEFRSAIELVRTAMDPDAPRPIPSAPGGEPAMIHPPFSREVEDKLKPRVMWLDIEP